MASHLVSNSVIHSRDSSENKSETEKYAAVSGKKPKEVKLEFRWERDMVLIPNLNFLGKQKRK